MTRDAVQKKLSGEIIGWDLQTRMVHVRFRKWWEAEGPADAVAPFLLDPYAIVTSDDHGSLRFSELKVGQQATLLYVTGGDGGPLRRR